MPGLTLGGFSTGLMTNCVFPVWMMGKMSVFAELKLRLNGMETNRPRKTFSQE